MLKQLDEEVVEEMEDEVEGQGDTLEEVCISEEEDKKIKACADLISQQRLQLVHPNDILRTLRLFLEENDQARDKAHTKMSSVKERDSSEDSAYWGAMANVIPENKLKVWNCLEDSLGKYFQILVKRSNLNTEKCSLAQQNAEFRLLLQQYMHSSVNNELEIPPTQLMQFSLDQQ